LYFNCDRSVIGSYGVDLLHEKSFRDLGSGFGVLYLKEGRDFSPF